MFYDFLLASHTESRYYLKMICTVLLKLVTSQACFEQASIDQVEFPRWTLRVKKGGGKGREVI